MAAEIAQYLEDVAKSALTELDTELSSAISVISTNLMMEVACQVSFSGTAHDYRHYVVHKIYHFASDVVSEVYKAFENSIPDIIAALEQENLYETTLHFAYPEGEEKKLGDLVSSEAKDCRDAVAQQVLELTRATSEYVLAPFTPNGSNLANNYLSVQQLIIPSLKKLQEDISDYVDDFLSELKGNLSVIFRFLAEA